MKPGLCQGFVAKADFFEGGPKALEEFEEPTLSVLAWQATTASTEDLEFTKRWEDEGCRKALLKIQMTCIR